MMLLKSKQILKTESTGTICTVSHFLGGGGQGEVYQADMAGQPVAVKWYFPNTATPEQRAAITQLVQRSSPSHRFLWPMDLVSAEHTPGFGYVMPLRSSTHKNIVDLMKRRVDPSWRTLAMTGMQLADSFLRLHTKGLCYRDISFGNVFFDPQTGDVLICDNDNVGIDSETKGGVLGTPRFMAPEIVRAEALPSSKTDLYSLAVLLFYLFAVHHPLEGRKEASIRCMDLPAMTKLYGAEPLFIFDPNDDSNRPVPGYHDNAIESWPVLPAFLQDLFTKSFTKGLSDPENGRVRESEWRAAMAELMDTIVYCPSCNSENFVSESNGPSLSCWSCRNRWDLSLSMKIGRQTIVLNHDTRLFPHHVDASRLYDFSLPVAEIVRHPKQANVWGLKNLSPSSWSITTVSGETHAVEPGRSLTLARGTRIAFGQRTGEIC